MRYLLILIFLFSNISLAEIISKEELKSSYDLSENWFINSFNQKGLFNYIYDAHLDSYSDSNNAIRQLMASRLLAELSNEKPELKAKHKENLNFIFKYWIKEKDNYKYVYLYNKSKLGANAMFLRTLVISPFYEEYKKEAELVKNSVLQGINSDGSMKPFLIEPNYQYNPDYLLTFYSGEALVSLIEYYNKTKDKELLKIIIKSQDFYIDKYVNNLSKNYYPAYVPWHTISLNKLYKITKDKKYSNAIFVLNDKLLELQDRANHIGRFFNPFTPQYGNPHASSDGVYAEGLVYAYEIAKLVGDESRRNIYEESIKIAFLNLKNLQYVEKNSSHLPKPEKAIGAFRIRKTLPDEPFSSRPGSNIRIDSVQHTMDGFRKYFSLW